ncbi:hypothetical protein DOTSEDRAFT_48328, partial [Dothistroma septosporum NZE10]
MVSLICTPQEPCGEICSHKTIVVTFGPFQAESPDERYSVHESAQAFIAGI